MMTRFSFLVPASLIVFAGFAGAAQLDLTTAGSSGTLNTAFFQQVPDQSTGTGVIDPFVRVQANNVEEGYNTDAGNPLAFDAKSGIWTHSLLVGNVPVVDVNGTSYLQFLLDINEVNSGDEKFLTLDQVRIYTNPSSGSVNSTTLTDLGTLRYNLDSNVDNSVKLNYGLNPGSGAGDMFMYVPANLFAGLGNQYLYLYSKFGESTCAGCGSSDGFEEWATVGATSVVPEPGFYGVLSLGFAGLLLVVRKRKRTVR